MKINKALTSTLTLSLLIAFLTGCGGAGSYVDDVAKYGDDAAKAAQKIAKQSGDKADDVARVINNTDEALKFAKNRGKACAKKVGKNAAKEIIATAISSKDKQISQEKLFHVSRDAIQKCFEVKLVKSVSEKLKKSVQDDLLNQEAKLVVSEVKQEYQGQIEFVPSSSQL
jgi:hypothetical protein